MQQWVADDSWGTWGQSCGHQRLKRIGHLVAETITDDPSRVQPPFHVSRAMTPVEKLDFTLHPFPHDPLFTHHPGGPLQIKSDHTSSLRKNFHSEKNPNSWEALPDSLAAPEALAPVHRAAALSAFSQCHRQAHPHWGLFPLCTCLHFLTAPLGDGLKPCFFLMR